MFYEIMATLFTVSLVILPIIGYFAHKNNWKITEFL
jgi:hypothetical protein